MPKNPCGKSMDIENPYEIWKNRTWEWRVLKKYQTELGESKNKYARWFCAVKSPFTHGSWDYGDCYKSDIVTYAECVYKKGVKDAVICKYND